MNFLGSVGGKDMPDYIHKLHPEKRSKDLRVMLARQPQIEPDLAVNEYK